MKKTSQNSNDSSSTTASTPGSIARRSGRIPKPFELVRSTSASVEPTKVGPHSNSATAPPKQSNSTAKSESTSNSTPWKHPAELAYIRREDWSQDLMIEYLCKKSFSIPPRDSNSAHAFFQVTPKTGSPISIPRKYRIPLLFLCKFQWDSLRLVLNSSDTAKEWQEYKFDIIHISRLCQHFLDQARDAKEKRGPKGLEKTWRSPMFDRVLTRFYHHWFISQEWSIKHFYEEFDEEEYEIDVLKYDWGRWALKGHKGFHLTKEEIQNGISAEEITRGLTRNDQGEWTWDMPLTDLTMSDPAVADSNPADLPQADTSSQLSGFTVPASTTTPAHNTIEVKRERLDLNGGSFSDPTSAGPAASDPSQTSNINSIIDLTPGAVTPPHNALPTASSTTTNPLPDPSPPTGSKRPREEDESISAKPKKKRTIQGGDPRHRRAQLARQNAIQSAPVAPQLKNPRVVIESVVKYLNLGRPFGPAASSLRFLPSTENQTLTLADSISQSMNGTSVSLSSAPQANSTSQMSKPPPIVTSTTSAASSISELSPMSQSSSPSTPDFASALQKSASPKPLSAVIEPAAAVAKSPSPKVPIPIRQVQAGSMPPQIDPTPGPIRDRGGKQSELMGEEAVNPVTHAPLIQESSAAPNISSTFRIISKTTQASELRKSSMANNNLPSAASCPLLSTDSGPSSDVSSSHATQTTTAPRDVRVDLPIAPLSSQAEAKKLGSPSNVNGSAPKHTALVGESSVQALPLPVTNGATVEASTSTSTNDASVEPKSAALRSSSAISESESNRVVVQPLGTNSGISTSAAPQTHSAFDSIFPGLSVQPPLIQSTNPAKDSRTEKDPVQDMDVDDQSNCPPNRRPNAAPSGADSSVGFLTTESTRAKSLHTILLLRELLDFLRSSLKSDSPALSVRDNRRERPSVFDARTRYLVLDASEGMSIDQRLEILTHASVGLAKLLITLRGEALEARVDTLDKRLEQEFEAVWTSEDHAPRVLGPHAHISEEKEVQTSTPTSTSQETQTTFEEQMTTKAAPELVTQGVQATADPEPKPLDNAGVQTDDASDSHSSLSQPGGAHVLSPDATMVDLFTPQPPDVHLPETSKVHISAFDRDRPVAKLMVSIMRDMADLLDRSAQKDPIGVRSAKGKEREVDEGSHLPNGFIDSPIVTAIMNEFRAMKDEMRQGQQWNREELQSINLHHRTEVELLKAEIVNRERKVKQDMEELKNRHREEVERLIGLMEKDREKDQALDDEVRMPALELLELRRRVSTLERQPSGSGSASNLASQPSPPSISRLEIPAQKLQSHPLGHLMTHDYDDNSSISSPRIQNGPFVREASISKPGTPMSDRQSFSARQAEGMDVEEKSMPLPIKSQRKAHMMSFPRHVG